MKHHFRRLIALMLVLCMVCSMAITANAAAWGGRSNSLWGNSVWGISSWLNSLLNSWWGNTEEEETETPSEEIETPVQDSASDPGMMLALVEDQSTVSEAVVMRAAVYEADENDPVAQAELQDDNVVYYPSTFFDYDHNEIAQSMANLDVQYAVDNGNSTSSNGWTWNGLYFGFSRLDDNSPTGTYNPGGESYTSTHVQYSTVYSNRNSTAYYYLDDDGNYYLISISRTGYSNNRRYTITYTDGNGDTQTPVSSASNTYITLYTLSSNATSVTSSSFAAWMNWGQDNNSAGPSYIHSGIVTGLVNGVPQFANSYASQLFDATELEGKTRYENIGLPFVLGEDGYYTFDSATNGAYLDEDTEVTSDGLKHLTLLDAPIVMHNGTQKRNHSSDWYTGFMPLSEPDSTTTRLNYRNYDDSESTQSGDVYKLTLKNSNGSEYTTTGQDSNSVTGKNYYFSFITSVPFTMTENGRIINSDDTSAPIEFEFTGDDDVWVFIDDVLVLDLGGIHDCVSGEINFAANEVTFQATGSSKATGDATETYDIIDSNDPVSQGAIFDGVDSDGNAVEGKLNTTRSTFAASDNHTLTVVYVERGDGLSNNKIRFNLPQKDYVAVSKNIDGNLYQNTDETTVVDQITDELFATLNSRDFTYVLYENGAAMTGVRFSRYDVNGNFTGNGTTASDGTFTVKNGETVRFYDVAFDGQTSYYVAELDPDTNTNNNAWGTATWAHAISTAYADDATVTTTEKPANYYVSDTIVTAGSEEAVDVISFTNTNKLLSPVADIANDEYVIDFGLAVELNPLANDTYSATTDSLTLTGISDAVNGTFGSVVTGEYGTLEIRNGKVVYTLAEQFTGSEVFYYQVGLTSGADELEDAVGTITIMPATTMYYEESFAGLDLNLVGSWVDKGTAQGGYQEEGRVGNTADSPYGSDAVYKNNSGDSYGTSKYINTQDGSASFSYTFTGAGSALYARTSDRSAYMMITVTAANGETVYTWNRNTIYKPVEDTQLTDNTLYNIPVFVYQAEEYGTYTVEVFLTKAMEIGGGYYRGCDFYLDGIRVYNPANAYTESSTSEAITLIEDAYARDGEAYITVDTLRQKLLLDSTKFVQTRDEEGNLVYDENGDPVYDLAWDGVNYVVFTDSDGTVEDVQTYQSAGPKEELYVKNGQSVTFSLDNWDQNRNKVYLGIKAPSGSGVVSINGNEIAINNTTDIYYDVTSYAEVSGGVATFEVTAGSALISVTTIKVTGTADFTIISRGPALPEESTPENEE